MVVFDTKVIHHQRKDNVARDVAEETGGGGLVEAVGGKMVEKAVLGQLACLLQTVHRFVDAEKEVGFAGGGRLNGDVKFEVGKDKVGEKASGDFYKLGKGKGGAQVVVSQVDRPEEGVSGDDRVEKKIHAGERGDVGGGGQEDSKRSPLAVPRTRRSTSEVGQWRGPGGGRRETISPWEWG